MRLIMLSGGSGQRLWPLSNDVRSKQFLKVLENERGEAESMVQRVYRQLKRTGGWESISIVTGQAQKDYLYAQLGEGVDLIIEPERRNTFPAILLSCAALCSAGIGDEETIAVMPVDPFVEDEYFRCIQAAEEVLDASAAELVLLGAVPVKPTEKYGYIVPAGKTGHGIAYDTFSVKYFKEKPSMEQAEELIAQGALWNCGVFVLKLKYIKAIAEEFYGITDFSYDSVYGSFSKLEKISFDYAVVERAKSIEAIRYEGQWKDLGTWETLSEEMSHKISGNAIADELCCNLCIINETETPVLAMGIEDAVIAVSRDGVLVASVGQSYRIKEFAGDLKRRPMLEERRWGKYEVLEYYQSPQEQIESLTKKLHISAGKQISYQYHNHRKEIWTITTGTAMLYLDGEKRTVSCGDVVVVEKGVKHGIKALTDMSMIEVQIGEKLVEEDIIRLELNW